MTNDHHTRISELEQNVRILAESAQRDQNWQIDKRIPIATILGMLFQTVAVVWWAATIDGRVTALEQRANKTDPLLERVIRMEVTISNVERTLSEVKNKLERH